MYRVFELFALVDHRMVISQGALLVLRNYTVRCTPLTLSTLSTRLRQSRAVVAQC